MLITITDLIKETIEVYKKQWKRLIKYPLILVFAYLVSLFVSIIILFFVGLGGVMQLAGQETMIDSSAFVSLFSSSFVLFALLLALIIFLVTLVFTAIGIAFVRAINTAIAETEGSTSVPTWDTQKSVLWRAVGVNLLVGLYSIVPYLAAMLLMMLAVPGVLSGDTGAGFGPLFGLSMLLMAYGFFHALYVTVAYMFAMMDVALKGSTIKEAMTNSKKMVKGRWWAMLFRLVIPAFVFVLPFYVFQLLAFARGTLGVIMMMLGILYLVFVAIILLPTAVVVLYRKAQVTVGSTAGAPVSSTE